ncbi:MAG: hypothetical protein SVX43_01290, partial [Cyanobacteriota bacterium]|nr:hypothetical protein [Cyanobacteriota bacterium]
SRSYPGRETLATSASTTTVHATDPGNSYGGCGWLLSNFNGVGGRNSDLGTKLKLKSLLASRAG